MAVITEGTIMPDFVFDTPFEKGRSLGKTAERVAGKTALLFLRYYGCTLCQYDIHQYAVNYDKIKEVEGQVLIVLQSDPMGLADQLEPDSLPFDIICDPEQSLYKEFQIKAAESKAGMVSPETVAKIGKATMAGFKHGTYEGNELQLPAVFIMDRERKVSFAHYGTAAGDVPNPDKMAELLK